ncbi:Protein of unknown function [Cotesia congregata]|uniref:Uncharacterized protein n=1 Tax=Cotesia congregata TaxID=51543 RepID=A0A8J2HAT1_COTCN|nr:Protein of unknown function [Cotesia congregata]
MVKSINCVGERKISRLLNQIGKIRRYKMDPELNPTTAGNSLMYQAIEDELLKNFKFLLENGMDVNERIITTGEFNGFTALN